MALDYAPFESLNNFFTLALGLVFVYYFQKSSILAFVPLVASFVLNLDYGIYGIALIGCMHFYEKTQNWELFWQFC